MTDEAINVGHVELYGVNIVITHKNNKPCIELRKVTTDEHIIKSIIESAWNNQPIVVQPSFTNRIKAINTLIEKGIISRNTETGDYDFNI
jgi:hypothetical protein